MFAFLTQELEKVNPWLIILFLIVVGCAFTIFIVKVAVKEAMREVMRDAHFKEDFRNAITYANVRAIEQSRGKSGYTTGTWNSDQTK